ncbi:hypothetical protein Scep_027688 [Stephania cephalantha]|uniref:Uncharacterized protein n=1 Tax=Stephania cephalantha TaxID=152367 RepID=A0AAP0HLC1_9MAGN
MASAKKMVEYVVKHLTVIGYDLISTTTSIIFPPIMNSQLGSSGTPSHPKGNVTEGSSSRRKAMPTS